MSEHFKFRTGDHVQDSDGAPGRVLRYFWRIDRMTIKSAERCYWVRYADGRELHWREDELTMVKEVVI